MKLSDTAPVCPENCVTLLDSEQPKLHRVLAVLSVIGLKCSFKI